MDIWVYHKPREIKLSTNSDKSDGIICPAPDRNNINAFENFLRAHVKHLAPSIIHILTR
jgi:hypothetical protein